jgi:CheY-like chemotaxis protein
MQKAGCQVVAMSGGIEAYEIARDRVVDGVITGSRLSSGDATQLLFDLRRLSYDIPVVLFGTGSEEITHNEAMHLGFSASFRAAFPTLALAEALARSLEFVAERKKKKVERVMIAGEAQLSFGEPPSSLRAPILNLSRGGIFVSLDRGFPPLESSVAYEIFLADLETPMLSGKALVRWVRENPGPGQMPGVGLEFVELPREAETMIEEHMRRASARRGS